MADINRQDIIRGMMAEVDGLSYSMASASLEAVLTCVTQALANHKSIMLSDFGKFGVRLRRARSGSHPRTHQPITIPEAVIPHFTPSPHLKKLVQKSNEPNSDVPR
ncbi:HU family DNA-binding protein [Pseudanabaena sp. FACHB-1277]|jgi:DNA-binding protein HU-beta|uniref:HU family DNA-binding protein n=1 Tax=Pseudanabaena cinerea FACHB-1277 TaxID=2949581 RepID=A0A926USK5_9CYAN|nr:HU family DNA-binding protein [Pseudanabaena cinerea]MBD2150314.1 HU family DNA-binding protein [Pseudanabaena cinerea FACHB-1277]